jgi:hypothetical protein
VKINNDLFRAKNLTNNLEKNSLLASGQKTQRRRTETGNQIGRIETMNPATNPATSKAKTRAATAKDDQKIFANGEFIGKFHCATCGLYLGWGTHPCCERDRRGRLIIWKEGCGDV